ncbi:cytochrome P450 [Cristinia sonorae]|uniref:Cytochrome P450 n=1 Tax=Cristinia sonorae TaxID=1940300 RepID=A0A8K0XMC4_9AGAR|nr:cytochrome P450 [Cristinia sonorae]
MLAYQYLSLALATVAWRVSPFHPLAKFPGPLLNKMTSLKLAHMVWSGKRHLVIYGLHQKYGKVVRTGPNTISFNSYAAITPIYGSSNAFSKSPAYKPGKIHGAGLFFIQPRDEHNVRRKHWAPAFTPTAVAGYKPVVEKRTNQLMECMVERRKGPQGTINLSEVIQHWSYDLMGDLTFGGANRLEMMKDNDVGNYVESGQMATVAFESLGEVPALFDIIWYFPVTKTITLLDNLAAKLLVVRQQTTQNVGADIASHLLGEHDTALPKLSQDDLRMDALFAIQAGSDTTSGVLTFVFYYLLANPKAYERLRAELDEAFPDPDAPLNLDLLTNLPYLNGVVDESLRLGTPFPGLPRITPQGGAMIDGVFIPEGTIVGVPAYTQEIHPENFWPEPEAFKPERWLPEGLGPGSRARRGAIMSFSFGPFGCLGKSLAVQEMRVVTAKMLLTYDLKFAPDFDNAAFVEGIQNMRTTIFRTPLNVVATHRR